jgi:hypothetical protein
MRGLALLFGLAMVLACGDDGGGGSLCESGCEATVAANCSIGPSTQAQCVSDCEDQRTGACGSEYEALLQCSAGEDVACDSSTGIPIVPGCPSEQSAFLACINN